MSVIDLRGQRIDVHVRKRSLCAFNVETGIDLTGALLHANVMLVSGEIWFALNVEVLDAVKGTVRLTASDPLVLYDTDAPASIMRESDTLAWGLAKHVVSGDSFYHEPIAYGVCYQWAPRG